jgi:hypothetical protein
MILKDCVTEPEVTNTVSYFILSTVMITEALGDVMKVSFLQEKKSRKDIVSIPRVFIDTKNNNKEGKEETS